MPALTCTKVEILAGHEGKGSLQSPCTEVQRYRVYFSDNTAVAQDAMHATDGTNSIPTINSSLNGTYTGLILQNIDPKQDESDPRIFIVTCTYTARGPQQLGLKPANQTKYNVDIAGSIILRQYEADRDVNNKTIVCSNGCDPISGIMLPAYDEQINVSFHTRTPDWATLESCKGCSNNAPVTLSINGSNRTFANHTLKLENWAWSLEYDPEMLKTVRMDLVFMYRNENWTLQVADKGFHTKTGSGNTTNAQPITMGMYNAAMGATGNATLDGTIKGTPTYLDGSGGILTAGSNVTLLPFENVKKVSFTTLLAEIST